MHRTDTDLPGRLLVWLLGGWIALTIWMSYVAIANFKTLRPERLRDSSEVYAAIPAGAPRERALRYAASELNRHFFQVYAWVQVGVAVAALALFGISRPRGRIAPALLGLVAALSVGFAVRVVPEIVEAGRVIDFMERDPERPEVARFRRIHGIAVGFDAAKLAFLVALSGMMLWPRRPPSLRDSERAPAG